MKRRRFFVAGIIIILIVPLTWVAWVAQPGRNVDGQEAVVEANPESSLGLGSEGLPQQPSGTLAPTESPSPGLTAEPTDTLTVPPTLTPIPTSTPTPQPTYTPTKTPTITPSPFIVVDNVDRTCPDPAPLRPEYDRYYVPAQQWPAPSGGVGGHLWLSHPFEGGGRLLYTNWFPYGYDAGDRYLIHNGLDVSEPLGTPVLAMADGTVVVAGDDFSRLYGWRCDWYGHLVVIELDDRWLDQPVYILYGHVLEISVEVGQRVSRGDQVAEVGVGGAATLPHLHFEVRVGTNEFGSTRNPLLWLNPPASRGVVAGRIVDPQGRPWQGVAINAIGKSEGTETYVTWSYLGDPQKLIQPDEVLAENFVFGDMRPGRYEIIVLLQDIEYRTEVEVIGGEVSTVEIVTEPVKSSTPEPVPTGGIENLEETPVPGDGTEIDSSG